MGYADLESAKAQLDLDDGEYGDSADIAMLAAIDAEVSRDLELKTGRRWGGIATPRTRTIDGPADCWGVSILLLPAPIRSVTSVAITGDLPETLLPYDDVTGEGDYLLWNVTRSGDALALRRVQNGSWPNANGINRVEITGIWSDEQNGEDVPPEITDAATFITVETFRQRKSSPTGEIGTDSFTIRPRNPWLYTVVTEAIKRYGTAQPVVSF